MSVWEAAGNYSEERELRIKCFVYNLNFLMSSWKFRILFHAILQAAYVQPIYSRIKNNNTKNYNIATHILLIIFLGASITLTGL